jgi:2-polyprenyl-6-methoxyphenol hydroxylase-like FAD-dependent oxidoreductase
MQANTSHTISAEIIVVGAGMAGVTAAAVLGQQGYRIIMVDRRLSCPPLFRCEKLEPHQAQMLRKFGLLEHLLPKAGHIREIRVGYDGRCFKSILCEQYSMYYNDMVNALRARAPVEVEHKIGDVEHISTSNELQRVRLKGGEELTSRLVVLASGVSNELQASLGLRKKVIQKDQSSAFGFSIARLDGQPFSFDAITYYPTTYEECVDYVALFALGEEMRANLFFFRPVSDPWVRKFIAQPGPMLEKAFPKLRRMIGDFRVVTTVETGRIDIYRVDGEIQPGIVLIGDAFQVACPSTGMGFTKIFTDVEVLSECVPAWFATPGIGAGKIASFYNCPRKKITDDLALKTASYRRNVVMNGSSMIWRFHRIKTQLPRVLGKRWSARSEA